MKTLTLNHTERAREAAALISDHCFESHRGAMRHWNNDADETFCIVFFGNDGFTQRDDSHPVIDARTKSRAHNLYAGLANLLPEGAVEFGTDEEGYSWVILDLAVLPSAARPRVKYQTTGSESYLAGSTEFTAAQEPAFRVFNRLVAQVPAVTVVLEYDDVKSAKRRQLRAVDGRIVEHRPV